MALSMQLVLSLAIVIINILPLGLAAMARHTSTVVRLGSDQKAYYMHPTPLMKGVADAKDTIAQPCTLLSIGSENALRSSHDLQAMLDQFSQFDDVWSIEFMQTVVLQISPEANNDVVTEFRHILHQFGAQNVYLLQSSHHDEHANQLPQGPYFLQSSSLFAAYLLYPDTSGAFVVATVPGDDYNSFRALDASAYGETYPSALTVAVPSKLYYQATAEQPYAGLRIAIKDTMDLKGLKTGASSRAYTSLYPPRTKSAAVVQSLIDLGFVVVGKLKTTQFADSEWATGDWVDYHAPFNPRGDGYLTPSASSAGSASAVASYDWLDFALGSDALGSLRSPAAAHGLFGMRPSLGGISTDGVLPYSASFDTVAGLARTAAEFKTLTRALYGASEEQATMTVQKPTRLLYPVDYWPVQDQASQKVFDAYINRLETFLGIEKTAINLALLWDFHRPNGVQESLADYLEHVFEWVSCRDVWVGLLGPFLRDYEDKFGEAPALNPQIRFKVEFAQTVTVDQRAEGIHRLKVYRDWFSEHVIAPSENGNSKDVLVLPWTTGEPDYRDRYRLGPQNFTGIGFFSYNVATYAESPELLIPVGTTTYKSKITGREEYLPAAIGLTGAKGSDLMLASLIAELEETHQGSSKENLPDGHEDQKVMEL